MRKDAPHAAERKAARAVVEGRVQGVGFRYWTVQVARELGITGWVRNCPDYSVEIFAEGDGATRSIRGWTLSTSAFENMHTVYGVTAQK